MNRYGLENGGDRILLIVGMILAAIILLLSFLERDTAYSNQSQICARYCVSKWEKENTLSYITDVGRKNIALTKCYRQCME